MDNIRFSVDHYQLGLVVKLMEGFLNKKPKGEVQNLFHSILEQLVIRLRRRRADNRLEYKFILPVYQAIAFRRIVRVGLELLPEGQPRTEMRIMMSDLDPKMTHIYHV